MLLTVFAVKGVPGNRRERIEAAVIAGGRSTRKPHESWIAVDPRDTLRVLMTWPDGFEPRHHLNTDMGCDLES